MIERTTVDSTTFFTESAAEILHIDEKISEDRKSVQFDISGSLRSDIRYDLRDELMLCAAMKMDILINMSGLTHIANSCMSVLLEVQQSIDEMNCGSLSLKDLPKEIYNALDSIGLTDLLMILD